MEDTRTLELEKRKDYRNAVFIQLVLIVTALTLEDLLAALHVSRAADIAWFFFLAAVAVYMYLLWDMLRNFTENRVLIKAVLGLLVLIYATSLVVNQFLHTTNLDRDPFNVALYSATLAIQVLIIAYAIRDLFRSPRNTVDKLWGSACIYFMSGIAFASLFHLIHLLNPAAFGQATQAGYSAFFEALYLSFNSLVGLDTAYPDATRLVRNTAVLEGMWGQLYLVLLIGRVLMPATGETPP